MLQVAPIYGSVFCNYHTRATVYYLYYGLTYDRHYEVCGHKQLYGVVYQEEATFNLALM